MPIELQSRSAEESDEQWLLRNKSLRMDANDDHFLESRREYHLERYRFAAGHAAGKDVLDAACGTGYGSELLGEVAAKVRGVDISQEAVDYAQRSYGGKKVRFVKSCVERTPFEDENFDLVASFETLEHTLSPHTAIFEFARVLRPDGLAIVSIPNRWGHTKNHFFDFDIPLLKSLVASAFGEAEYHYHNSGDKSHCLPKGIGPMTSDSDPAECVLAICRKPMKDRVPESLDDFWVEELYRNSFGRHREFLKLYRRRGGMLGRLGRSLKKKLKRR